MTAVYEPINFPLLAELAEKPHPLLNIADDLHQVPVAWLSEVMQEARTAHHLLDMVSILDGASGLAIETLEGTMLASAGDWIIRGVKGEYYPCKPDIFEATYERVDRD